jgi:hypothetical protein
MNLRRLYLYLVCTVALTLLTIGLVVLGSTVLQLALNPNNGSDTRTSLANFTALVVVAGPVWAIHFWFAQRFALRDPYDRASTIRHLYLYVVCLAAALGSSVAIAITAGDLIRPVIDSCTADGRACLVPNDWTATAQAAWAAGVLLAVWAFHFWISASDRKAAAEEDASATLRRWYMYASLLVGMLMMLAGLAQAIDAGWLRIVQSPQSNQLHVGDGAGEAIAGFLLWGFHARTIARHVISDDRHSTLRALQGFIVVAVSIATALTGASMILYYALARLLGVASPGGVNSHDIAGALAAPASQVIVYGIGWILVSRRLARDAGTQEADRQAGIRRLYVNLVCLVSLAGAAIGAGGLLWSLAEQAEAPIIGVPAPDWRDPASLWATLLVVGAAVWVAHWRHAPWAADRQSFSRRLYVWAALLGSVLAVLAGGVGMLNAVLQQVFSANPRLNAASNLDVGHYLAVIVIAAAVGAYHGRVLRADMAARPPKAATPPAIVSAPVPVPQQPAPVAEPSAPGIHGRRYTLTVTDATEDDIHQALSTLPPRAGYHLEGQPAMVDAR